MPIKPVPRDYQYCGALAGIISAYIAEKRATGVIYNTEAKKLAWFSRMSLNYDLPANTLTEEAVLGWISRRPGEADKTLYYRYSVIKGLANYMQRMGYDAYCPLPGDIPKLKVGKYVPHIFTYQEVLKFFNTLDADVKGKSMYGTRFRGMCRIIFRLLYCCGLRMSEAIGLTSEDIDWDEQLLIIRDSKFDKSRYIPMSDEMARELRLYIDRFPHEPCIFPSLRMRFLNERAAYKKFREILQKAGIPHEGRGKGPRLHDFRHTFAVHCLQKWIREGTPLSSALPRLSTYLGHNDISSTERYLRMTAEMYPEIAAMLSLEYGHLIPKGWADDENN